MSPTSGSNTTTWKKAIEYHLDAAQVLLHLLESKAFREEDATPCCGSITKDLVQLGLIVAFPNHGFYLTTQGMIVALDIEAARSEYEHARVRIISHWLGLP